MTIICTKTRKILANNVVYYRIKNNLSQEKLAELIGTKPAYISEIENAKRSVSCDYIDSFAKVFKIEPHELLINRSPVKTRRISRSKR